jgi:hypothetical protein
MPSSPKTATPALAYNADERIGGTNKGKKRSEVANFVTSVDRFDRQASTKISESQTLRL